MKLTLQLRLLPAPQQVDALLRMMEQFNAAATYAARVGFDAGVFSQPSIHHRCYRELRERFGLSSQQAVRAIGKAVECFSRDRKVCPVFQPHGAVTLDNRTFSFKGCDRVSLLTLNGRMLVPLVFGQYQAERFGRLRGQADLVYRKGQFFLYATGDFPESPPIKIAAFLGIDLGIANIATDSAGEQHSGETIDRNRRRRQTARKQYQRRGTKNAKRRLRQMAGRQARFQRHINHTISKRIVAKAKALGVGIALEDLKGIRGRVEKTVGKSFRRRFGNWSFHQLRLFVGYKARREGVPVVTVDPRNTSRTCSQCGYCAKGNRPDQAIFRCQHCHYSTHADFNAALNISASATRKLAAKAAADTSSLTTGEPQSCRL